MWRCHSPVRSGTMPSRSPGAEGAAVRCFYDADEQIDLWGPSRGATGSFMASRRRSGCSCPPSMPNGAGPGWSAGRRRTRRCGGGGSTCCRPGSTTPFARAACGTWSRSICATGPRSSSPPRSPLSWPALTSPPGISGVTALYAHIPEAPGGLLAPESAVRAGALIGYAWVNTSGQLLDRLQHALAQVMTGALACVAVLTPLPARCPTAGRGRERRRP